MNDPVRFARVAVVNDPVRFAIIGCGLIGKKRLASLRPGQFRFAFDLDRARAEDLVKVAGCGVVGDNFARHDPFVGH